MYKFSLIIFFLIFTQNKVILGQEVKIDGFVCENKVPLSYASIKVKSFATNDLLGYGTSDENGNYNITVSLDQSNKFFLIASYIGYKQDTIIISRSDLLSSKSSTYNFTLIEDAKQLDAIYIKAPPIIAVNEDTTTYNVSRFTSPEDRNLESVIKKMPGMEVDKNGTISFKGKRIAKVLLEGDDLTGDGYKAITKNLKPQFVEEIQAIEHYVEDDLLKGIINSDDIVLNLKIKDKKAQKIVGSVDAGIGTNDLRLLNSNVISFLNKTKAFAFLNHSNLNDQSNNLLALTGIDSDFDKDNRIIKHEVGTYNPFDGTLYTINNTTSGSLNAITRINDKFKINYSLGYYRSRLLAQTTLENIYFPPNAIRTIDNDYRIGINKTLLGDFKADYLVKSNARFWTKFAFKTEPKDFVSTAFSIFNNIAGDSVLQNLVDRNHNFNGQLKYTVKVNKTTAYLVSARILSNNVSQNYRTNSQLYQDIPLFNSARGLFQEVDNRNFKLKLDLEGLKRYQSSFFYFNLGNEISHFNVNSNLFAETQDVKRALGANFFNDNVFKMNRSFVLGKYVFDQQPIKLHFQLKTIFQQTENGNIDTALLILEPNFSLSYKLSEIQNIALSYNYKNTNPEPVEYYENYILTGLRSFNGGLTNFYNFNTHLIGLNYNLNDFSNSYFSLNASFNASYSENGFLYTNVFIDRLNYSKKEPFKGIKTLNANFSAKKFLPIFSMSVTANYTPSIATYYSKIADETKQFTAINDVVMFKINTGFDLPINFGIGTELQINRTKSEGVLVARNFAKNYTFEYRYKITNKIFHSSSLDRYSINGSKFNLIDTEFQYNPIKGVFKFSLQGKNLANVYSFKNFNINEVYSSSYVSSILGRYILFNISMSIK